MHPVTVFRPKELYSAKDEFKKWLVSEGFTSETIRNFVSQFLEFSSFCSSRSVTIDDLSINVARDYMTWLMNRPNQHNGNALSAATRIKHYYCLKRISLFLQEKKLITDDFTKGIRKPSPKKAVIQGFSEEQLQVILDTVQNLIKTPRYRDRTTVLLYLLVCTGLRINEALNLHVNSIDHARGIMVVLGKGNKEREVPFSATLSQLILNYIQKYNIDNDQYLFASRYGKPLAASSIRDILRKAKKAIGPYLNIDQLRVSPHTFRHTFAKLWILRGGNTIALSRIMGHSSTSTTDNYVRLWGIDLKRSYDLCNPCANINIPILQ